MTGMTRGRVRHRVHHAGGPAARPRDRERRPSGARRLAALTTILTLMALIGRAIADDCHAVQAVLEVWRHLQHVGF